MNLKQLLQSIREANLATTGPKGNRPSLKKAYAKVRQSAERLVAGQTSDKKPESKEQASKFLAQGKGPARRA